MRSNLILAIIAAVLAVPTTLSMLGNRVDFTEYDSIPRLYEGFTPDNVAAVVVTVPAAANENAVVVVGDDQKDNPVDTIQLRRTAEGWVIGSGRLTGAAALGRRVESLVFRHVEAIRRDEEALIAPDAADEDLEKYGLDEKHATLIQCFDAAGQPIAELYRGRNAAKGAQDATAVNGFFVRRKGYRDVILYEVDNWAIGATEMSWLERQPNSFEIQDVVSVQLANPKGTMELAKDRADDVDWNVVRRPDDAGAVRVGEIVSILQTLRFVQVQDFLDRVPPNDPARTAFLQGYGLDAPKIFASVKVASGEEYSLTVGKRVDGQNQYYALASSSPFLATLGDWQISTLERDPLEYFDPPAEAVTGDGQDGGKGDGGDGKGGGGDDGKGKDGR